MYIYLLIGLVVLLAIWSAGSYYIIYSIEKPTYTVVEEKDGYEIRQYEPYIVAETEVVAGNYQDAINQGFRIIADYIFGNNTSAISIAMTAPVLEQASEKIAMTAPVLESAAENGSRVVSFVLPSKYTLETLPAPNDSRVQLKEVPARKVAALQFSWYATEDRIEAKKLKLKTLIETDKLISIGSFQVAQYNPPLSAPFMRRNEILIPIAD